jgi:hypothetical protein
MSGSKSGGQEQAQRSWLSIVASRSYRLAFTYHLSLSAGSTGTPQPLTVGCAVRGRCGAYWRTLAASDRRTDRSYRAHAIHRPDDGAQDLVSK